MCLTEALKQVFRQTQKRESGAPPRHHTIALRQLELKQYAASEASYQKVLSLNLNLTFFDEKSRANLIATAYHQLGMVASQQRQWAQAKHYYEQALKIFIEFKDRDSQAEMTVRRLIHGMGYRYRGVGSGTTVHTRELEPGKRVREHHKEPP